MQKPNSFPNSLRHKTFIHTDFDTIEVEVPPTPRSEREISPPDGEPLPPQMSTFLKGNFQLTQLSIPLDNTAGGFWLGRGFAKPGNRNYDEGLIDVRLAPADDELTDIGVRHALIQTDTESGSLLLSTKRRGYTQFNGQPVIPGKPRALNDSGKMFVQLGKCLYIFEWTKESDKHMHIFWSNQGVGPEKVTSPPYRSPYDLKRPSDDWNRRCKLGSGTFGKVYFVKHRFSGEKAVEKIMKLNANTIDEVKKEVNNALAIARLPGHPFKSLVVSLMDVLPPLEESLAALGTESVDQSIFYTPYAEKVLSEVKNPGKMDVKLFVDIIKGLSFLHSHNFAHCDVKPQNIGVRIDSAGVSTSVILDVGLVTFQDQLGRPDYIGGTFRYMAPETVKGGWGLGVDIFAAGVTWLQCQTGKHYWEHFDDYFTRDMIKREHHPWSSANQESTKGALREARNLLMTSGKNTQDWLIYIMIDPEPAARPTAAEIVKGFDAGRYTKWDQIASMWSKNVEEVEAGCEKSD